MIGRRLPVRSITRICTEDGGSCVLFRPGFSPPSIILRSPHNCYIVILCECCQMYFITNRWEMFQQRSVRPTPDGPELLISNSDLDKERTGRILGGDGHYFAICGNVMCTQAGNWTEWRGATEKTVTVFFYIPSDSAPPPEPLMLESLEKKASSRGYRRTSAILRITNYQNFTAF